LEAAIAARIALNGSVFGSEVCLEVGLETEGRGGLVEDRNGKLGVEDEGRLISSGMLEGIVN
jgi:hypothetical protein